MGSEPAALDPDAALIEAVLRADPWRMAVLARVREFNLPDWAIGAGFVRSAVWDRLTARPRPTPLPDIDVIYFDAADLSSTRDSALEAELTRVMPERPWQVRNQARMHRRNGDAPYLGTADALRYWLETPTAVAVRLEADDRIEVIAPLGLDDLMDLRVRPTDAGRRRNAEYRARMAAKNWPDIWPGLRVEGLENEKS